LAANKSRGNPLEAKCCVAMLDHGAGSTEIFGACSGSRCGTGEVVLARPAARASRFPRGKRGTVHTWGDGKSWVLFRGWSLGTALGGGSGLVSVRSRRTVTTTAVSGSTSSPQLHRPPSSSASGSAPTSALRSWSDVEPTDMPRSAFHHAATLGRMRRGRQAMSAAVRDRPRRRPPCCRCPLMPPRTSAGQALQAFLCPAL
jgi:hypothetical protein